MVIAVAVFFSGYRIALADNNSYNGDLFNSSEALPENNQEDLSAQDYLTKDLKKQPATKAERFTLGFSRFESRFLKDSHFSVNLRNQYISRKYSHAEKSGLEKPADRSQWGQSISLDYISGYAFGFAGIDTSLYGALKLAGKHPQNGVDELLHTIKKGTKFSDSYSRIGRLNTKFFLGDNDNNVVLRYGFIGVNTSILADSQSRLLESSFRGGSVDAVLSEFNGLKIYGFFLDRIAHRSGNSYDRFIAKNGKKIDDIQIAGAAYTFKSLEDLENFVYVNGEAGKSKNYTKHYFGQISYNFKANQDVNFLANLQYRLGQKAGKLWDGKINGYDKKASQVNANILGAFSDIKVGFSYSHTNAKNNKNNITGLKSHQFNYELIANDYGKTASWTSRQVSNFNYDKEGAYQLMAGYDFTKAGLSGLSSSLSHTYGSGMNKAIGLKNEQETDLGVTYEFQQSQLKGLSLKLEQAWYVSRNLAGSMVKANRLRDTRVYANYNALIF